MGYRSTALTLKIKGVTADILFGLFVFFRCGSMVSLTTVILSECLHEIAVEKI